MEKAHTATASAKNLGISRKAAVEVASFIRGKDLKRAKKLLEGVLKKKVAVPYKRSLLDRGHQRGIGPGRFPEYVSIEILKLLKSAESNAQNKGLNTESLIISSILVNKGSTQWRYGRQKRRQAKRAHVELTLLEKEPAKKTKKEDKQ